jgi:hypothetical protein
LQKNNGALDDLDEDGFFDLLSRFQSRRIDDQRCSFRLLESAPSAQAAKTNGKELAALGKTGIRNSLSTILMALRRQEIRINIAFDGVGESWLSRPAYLSAFGGVSPNFDPKFRHSA